MYQILIIDKNQEISIPRARSNHQFRPPQKGEHVLVRWQGETRVCEVEDVWTHINLDQAEPYQGAVQVLVKWSKGLPPNVYVRRFGLR